MASKDTISSIVVFAFSLLAFVLARNFGGGSELFPRGLAAIMMVASAIIFVRAVFWPKAVPAGIRKMALPEVGQTSICVLLTIAYVALIVPVGFATSSIAFIIVIAYVTGLRSHLAIWLTAFGFVGALYFLFVRVFHTPLPADVILGFLHL